MLVWLRFCGVQGYGIISHVAEWYNRANGRNYVRSSVICVKLTWFIHLKNLLNKRFSYNKDFFSIKLGAVCVENTLLVFTSNWFLR